MLHDGVLQSIQALGHEWVWVAFRLHPLKGNRKGVWAVTVRANWRVTFRFEGGDAYDVDLEDYH